MIAYKLTDQGNRTRNNTLWGENVTNEILADLCDATKPLCTQHWFHYYEHPLIAILMNQSDANIENPRIWLAEATGLIKQNEFKSGCTKLTTIKNQPIKNHILTNIVAFSILCTLEVYKEPHFLQWAENWLSGKDRTRKAADSAYVANAATAYNAANAYNAYKA